MSLDLETERRPNDVATAESKTTEEVTSPSATFTSKGAIPPVATTTTSAASTPSASEQAFGPHVAKGAGIQALEALLAKGTPDPAKVVEVIDAHRDERGAIFELLESKLGAPFVEQVHGAMAKLRASVGRREVVAGDPNDPDGGYFIGSQAEQGARWRTSDGKFTGSAGKEGLDSSYKLDDRDNLHAHVSKDKTGTLAWEHDGRNEGELYANVHNGKDYEAGVRRNWDVDGGTLTTGLRHKATADGATDGAFGGYRTKDGRTSGEVALGVHDGHPAESATVTTKPSDHDSITGSVAHDSGGTTVAASGSHAFDGGSISGSAQVHQGPGGTTGSLAGAYQDHGTKLDGNLTRATDRTSLHLGGSQQLSPELGVSGHLDHVAPDHGPQQSTLGLSESYRSGEVVHGLDLEAGHGERDYFKSTGSVEAQLAPKLYGGAFGSYQMEAGHHDSAQLGASLTFTTSEKTALTLAGVVDQSGALETRLELDVFKSRIANVKDLADHQKDALVSLFISYSQGGNRHMLDERFGAPQATIGAPAGAGQVMGGIRIKF